MLTFLLWCILFIICWPLALLALVAYPFIWLLLLPFRIVGIAVHGVMEVIYLAITLPFRLLAAPFHIYYKTRGNLDFGWRSIPALRSSHSIEWSSHEWGS